MMTKVSLIMADGDDCLVDVQSSTWTEYGEPHVSIRLETSRRMNTYGERDHKEIEIHVPDLAAVDRLIARLQIARDFAMRTGAIS